MINTNKIVRVIIYLNLRCKFEETGSEARVEKSKRKFRKYVFPR